MNGLNPLSVEVASHSRIGSEDDSAVDPDGRLKNLAPLAAERSRRIDLPAGDPGELTLLLPGTGTPGVARGLALAQTLAYSDAMARKLA